MAQIPIIKVDTTEVDKATKKVEFLISKINELYDLSKKSWLLNLILRVQK